MEKDINGGRTLKRKEGKGGGFGKNRPLFLPPDQNTTRRGGIVRLAWSGRSGQSGEHPGHAERVGTGARAG